MGKDGFKSAWEDEMLESIKLGNERYRDNNGRLRDCSKVRPAVGAVARILAFAEGALGIAVAVKVAFIGSVNPAEDVALSLGLVIAAAATQWVADQPCFRISMMRDGGPGTGDKTDPPPKSPDPDPE